MSAVTFAALRVDVTEDLEDSFTPETAKQVPVLEYSPLSKRWETFRCPSSPQNQASPPSESSVERKLKIATWNIWFDGRPECRDRWTALYQTLFREIEDLDVVAMQEVIDSSWNLLLRTPEVRKDWVVVDFDSTTREIYSWYGVTMLVRKQWLSANGFDDLKAVVVPFPTSMGRCLLLLELGDAHGIKFRIGTAHFESLPEDKPFRRSQFEISCKALTPSSAITALPSTAPSDPSPPGSTAAVKIASTGPTPHAILLGDTNIYNPSELDPVFQTPFRFADAYAAAKSREQGTGGTEDDSTYGLTFPDHWGAMKIDYILFRPGEHSGSDPTASLRPCEARLLGNDPIPDKRCIYGRDGKLFPSDHLGVLVKFVWE